MPVYSSANVTAANNQQPTYETRPRSYAILPTLSSIPAIGSAMQFSGETTVVPDGDGSYTPLYVEPTAGAGPTTAYAGIYAGSGALGNVIQAAPNTISNAQAAFIAMLYGTDDVVQVLVDDAEGGTTYLDALVVSSATDGALSDTGAATSAQAVAITLETVAIASGTALVWARLLPGPVNA